jgi:hypothetical protein
MIMIFERKVVAEDVYIGPKTKISPPFTVSLPGNKHSGLVIYSSGPLQRRAEHSS